jgi:hypothetical protein
MATKQLNKITAILLLITATSALSAAGRRPSHAKAHEVLRGRAEMLEQLAQRKAQALDEAFEKWNKVITKPSSQEQAAAARKAYLAEVAAISAEHDASMRLYQETFKD